jgi:hypothetical protein
LSCYYLCSPQGTHAAGVVINHIVEVIVPFAYFLPQPYASIAGIVTIVFQAVLIVSGNLSWLNWLTVVLCIPLISDRWWSWLPLARPVDLSAPGVYSIACYVLVAVVAWLSIAPAMNMLSPGQMMNASFDPLHLVNTYGAFGSITRERYEIVLQGTGDATPTEASWKDYEFKGKPGDPARRPPQVAPYHLRLDWLMWFEAMSPVPHSGWFFTLLAGLLNGDANTLSLLRGNPFPDEPPRLIRAQYYRYEFTTPAERRANGLWWKRQLVGTFYGPAALSRQAPAMR